MPTEVIEHKTLKTSKEYFAKFVVVLVRFTVGVESGAHCMGGTLPFNASAGADCKKVKPKYREAFHILVDASTSMSFHGYHMNTGSAEQELPEQAHATRHIELGTDFSASASRVGPSPVFSETLSQTNRSQQGAYLANHA
eukprot:2109767-Amphidinium_carterae.2